MNREQMIEKAAEVLRPYTATIALTDDLAADVVSAILPQVTTKQQMIAMLKSGDLADEALLVNTDGWHARARDWTFLIWVKPLTVVWQP